MAVKIMMRIMVCFLGLICFSSNSQKNDTFRVVSGDNSFIENIFCDEFHNKRIKEIMNQRKHTLPFVVEFADLEQRIFQLFALKQNQFEARELTTMICGESACGIHAPKNAVYMLGALEVYEKLQQETLNQHEYKECVGCFLDYGTQIMHKTYQNRILLSRCNDDLIIKRKMAARDKQFWDWRGKRITKDQYITTAATYDDENDYLIKKVIHYTDIPTITQDNVSYINGLLVKKAAAEKNINCLSKDLKKKIQELRYKNTLKHAFVMSIDIDDELNSSSLNHLIAIVVEKIEGKNRFFILDSGYCMITEYYIIAPNGKECLEYKELGSKNLLKTTFIRDFVELITVTPIT